ncbi:protein kinase domain-containing protein [Phytoactinopolyspora mesophila]|uniref:protein kinase domain-containing protein n=1 Tax=Phytoactinopolyspora mesophila TaxID=2650750 RepID=UPI0013917208
MPISSQPGQALGANDPAQVGGVQLTAVLGRGGQGSVYLGRASGNRNVAVKVLHDQLVADSMARMRFIREAEIAQRVAAFCTAQVLDVGFEANLPYVVSEYIAGPSLQRLVAEDGPRTGSSLDRLAVTTLTALAAIHRAGIIHRDFKPGNVIMGPEGPVVIDFGIARFAGYQVTTGSAIVGTPAYIAPEQIRHEPAGTGSDVFAWAATMVFAATGRVAFGRGCALPAVIHAVLHEDPDLSAVPERIRSLLAESLVKQPDSRPSVEQLLGALTDDEVHRGQPLSPERTSGGARPAVATPHQRVGDDATALRASPTDNVARQRPTEVVPLFGQPVGAAYTGHTAVVTALAVDDSQGRPIVVSADLGQTIRAWDLVSGEPVGAPMRGHVDRISTILVTDIEGHPVVVSGDWTGRVKTWDLATGACLRSWDDEGEIVTVGRSDGRPILVRGGGTVIEVFDLSNGELIRRPLTIPFYHHDPDARPIVSQLAVAELDGRQVIVAGCRAEAVLRCAAWVFDLASGDPVPAPRRTLGGSVELMGVVQRDGQPFVVTYGRTPGLRRWAVRVWNLVTGEQPVKLQQSATLRRAVESMTVAELGGGPAVLASGERSVRVWDLATGNRIGEPIGQQADRITALAVTQVAGFPAVVAGCADASVHAWSLAP